MPKFKSILSSTLSSPEHIQSPNELRLNAKFSSLKTTTVLRNLMIAPFENKSGSTKFDYIAEGISDHLTNSLNSSVLLNIIPKSQSYKIFEENLSFQDLVDKYDISYLLNGTTLVANEKFRVNLELIDIHEEKVIWSANEEYLVDDIFSAQDNVELLVIKSLQKNLQQ